MSPCLDDLVRDPARAGLPRLRTAQRSAINPGEIEYRTEQRRRRAGIPIEDTTWRRLGEIAARFGISPPRTMRSE
jgi:LDH2 family malate/lactate/ureidoglycolate dehydrogenase